MNRKIIITIISIAVALGAIIAYQELAKPQRTIILNGAGASFPFPLIDKWISVYSQTKPNVQINYQSIGSGGGIRQHTEKTIDFGASDAPLNLNKLPTLQTRCIFLSP
ncbi:MAG: substrate-binding domain-containing protein [Thermoproteota archaeon]